MNDFTVDINGMTLEYFDDSHQYVCDGVLIPSISEILRVRFGNKYAGVDSEVLKKASDAGQRVHEAIQAYCENGTESDLEELRNFKFLKKQYGFEVLSCEVPVVLLDARGEPLAAGRLDLLLSDKGDPENVQIGLADIKRTAVLDKDYLFYQLNLYKIAFEQNSGMTVDFLCGIHLRNEKRKYVEIPINAAAAWALVKEYLEKKGKENELFN